MALNSLAQFCDRLEVNRELIRRLVQRFPERAVRERASFDEFSVVEHICHLRDLECQGFFPRLLAMLTQSDPQLFDFDGAAVARSSNYLSEHCGEALKSFLRARIDNIAFVRGAPAGALARIGHYEAGSFVTLADVLDGMLAHDEDHIKRLEAMAVALH